MSPRLVSSPASLRIMGGFLVVLGIFAVAALLTWRSLGRIVRATQEIVREQEGLEAALRLENLALRMDTVQATLMAGGDIGDIGRFDAVSREMEQERNRVQRLVSTSMDRDLLHRCAETQRRLESIFLHRFIPAVMSEERDAIERERAATVEAIGAIVSLSEQLKRGFEYRITEAGRRANQIRDDVLTYSGLLLFVAVLVAMLVAVAASRSVLTPIRHLVEATEAVARGDWERRIDENRRDEFGRLAESFNRMTAELKDQQQKVLQAQKMASIGRLAAGVAHEINNPIGVILGYTKMIRAAQELPEDVGEDLRAIEEEAEQCKEIVENLLNFSRPVPPSDTVIDLAALTDEVLDRAQPDAAVLRVKIIRRMPDRLTPVRADATRLRQVVRNVVRNALDAMSEGGELRVTLRRLSLDECEDGGDIRAAECIEAVFADTGCGITAEDQERLFEPFFSKKADGTGLGLAIVYNVVRSYGGTISVESRPGAGTTLRFRFPAAESGRRRGPEPKET